MAAPPPHKKEPELQMQVRLEQAYVTGYSRTRPRVNKKAKYGRTTKQSTPVGIGAALGVAAKLQLQCWRSNSSDKLEKGALIVNVQLHIGGPNGVLENTFWRRRRRR